MVRQRREAIGRHRLHEHAHVFSQWKTTREGHKYPSHVVGYLFENREKGTLREKQWYQTDILELTPLAELPAEVKK